MTDEELEHLVTALKKLGVEETGDRNALREIMENPAGVITLQSGDTVKMPLLPPAGIAVIAIHSEEFGAIFFIPIVE